jgi:hypothetical protein
MVIKIILCKYSITYIPYILDQLFSWGTSRIHLSRPVTASPSHQNEPRANPSPKYTVLVCLGPPSILLFVPPFHVSHVQPPLPIGQLNTSIQVNNMAMLHLIYSTTVIHICITFISLFLPFFILLPHFWAGWLAPVLLVGNNNLTLIILSTSRAVQPNKFIQNYYF